MQIDKIKDDRRQEKKKKKEKKRARISWTLQNINVIMK